MLEDHWTRTFGEQVQRYDSNKLHAISERRRWERERAHNQTKQSLLNCQTSSIFVLSQNFWRLSIGLFLFFLPMHEKFYNIKRYWERSSCKIIAYHCDWISNLLIGETCFESVWSEHLWKMGNAGSSSIPRERHKSSSSDMPSSPVLKDGQAFVFDKKSEKALQYQGSSHEEEEPYYTKPVTTTVEPIVTTSTTTSSANTEPTIGHNTIIDPTKKVLPTVFKWDGGGKEVFISGTFSEWKALPMVKSHGDFVTIIDLPEGEHEYKFCVDGEWKHDQKLVSSQSQSSLLTGDSCHPVPLLN